ncbi:uncharacterized protein LOC125940207 isoform X1 [Dermacentor silvarum]|uniref:uncharacterized protein LOC125940207 isoform X1 n=1 Tax=Dermacentor silvarum TaxID=543639 RepID=UPI00210153C0|nr:uncharacterized protein LOC125940207 isoform X1 [Dermacentor silvarum]
MAHPIIFIATLTMGLSLRAGTKSEKHAQEQSWEACIRHDRRTCDMLKETYPDVTTMYGFDGKAEECREFPWEHFSDNGACGAFYDLFHCFNTCTPRNTAPAKCFNDKYKPCGEAGCIETAYFYDPHNQKCKKYKTEAEPWIAPRSANCFGNRQTCKRECRGFTAQNRKDSYLTKENGSTLHRPPRQAN